MTSTTNSLQTLWEHLRWDLLVLAVLGLFILGYSAIQNPRFQPAESPMSSGSKPPDHSEGDVLLILPTAPTAEAETFDTLDCSFQWFNALWQHYGTVATTPSDMVSPQLLAGHTVAVVPARVAFGMSSTMRDHLEEFARNGGQLVVEKPRPRWEAITGLPTSRRSEPAERITDVGEPATRSPVGEHLSEVPLSGRRLIVDDLDAEPDAETVFDVDDAPGLFIRPIDDGAVYSLSFDYACSLAAMHQGKPDERMNFSVDEDAEFFVTSDRVADTAPTATSVPAAEVLQRALFDQIRHRRPLPRLWAFPAGFRGAAFSTHPAPSDPRAAFGYAARAGDLDTRATLFGAADRLNAHHVDIASSVDADIGLLWVVGQNRQPISEGVGVGAIQPVRRELSIQQQRERLERTVGDGADIDQVQLEEQAWEPDWDTTFRILTAAGMRLDTSFGPTEPDQYGYLFGSGMPYYPMDRRGQLLPILEVPSAFGAANLTPERLEELFETSSAAFHQPVGVNLGAEAMRRHPSADLLLAYRAFHAMADEYDHWTTTPGDYVDFLRARRQSVFTSRWSPNDNRLTVSVNLLGIRLPTLERGALPGVAVPERVDGRQLVRIEIDDEPVDLDETTTSGPGDERIIDLGPGRHVVSAFYESS